MSMATLMWGVLFGSIGLGYFVYGKKRGAAMPLISGIVLMAFPYFVSNAVLVVAIGAAFTALPWFVQV